MTALYRPMPGGTPKFQRSNLDGEDWGLGIPIPDITTLNNSDPPKRVPRMQSSGIAYFAGLMQWGTGQWWAGLFNQGAGKSGGTLRLSPPNVQAQMAAKNRGYRAVGGVLGAGTVSNPTVHIPSVRVPRTIT